MDAFLHSFRTALKIGDEVFLDAYTGGVPLEGKSLIFVGQLKVWMRLPPLLIRPKSLQVFLSRVSLLLKRGQLNGNYWEILNCCDIVNSETGVTFDVKYLRSRFCLKSKKSLSDFLSPL